MSDDDVRGLLEAAVRDEPPLTLDRGAILREGRRRLRVRRTATVGGTVVAVVAVVIGMSALSGAHFGMRDEIGPAQRPAVTAAPPSTTREATPTTPSPTLTTTREAEVLPPLKLGAALRDAKVAWPDTVGRVGEGDEWYAFDASRSATFHLVTADKARRLVTVAVGTAPGDCPGDGCVEYPLGDPRTRVYVRELPPTEPAAPRAVEVVALRGDGVVVRVLESAGFGPPWRAEPVLPVATLVGLATIPGFAAR